MPIHCYMVIATDPQAYTEVAGNPYWDAAMDEEYQSLMKNQTWELVPLPLGRKLVLFKWIYRTKRAADGLVSKYKARLVAKGFSQV